MPTYEYACGTCGIVEVFQSMRDDPLRRCPECGDRRFQRQISGGAGVIFRGSGFWETDYNRSSDYRKQAETEQGGGKVAASGEAGGGAGEGKAAPEAKPDKAKSAAKPHAERAGSGSGGRGSAGTAI